MRKMMLFGALITLTGCISNQVSPLLEGNPGITFGIHGDHIPTFNAVEFIRMPTDLERTSACLARNAGGGNGQVVKLGDSVSMDGQSTFFWADGPRTQSFLFSLTAYPSQGRYLYERIQWDTPRRTPLFAEKSFSPENAYAAMEEIVDRIVACAKK